MEKVDAGKLSQCNRRDVKGQGLRTHPNHHRRGGRAKSSEIPGAELQGSPGSQNTLHVPPGLPGGPAAAVK